MAWIQRPVYRDRQEAGERLAGLLEPLGLERPVVLGAPRGGVAVGFPVARRLGAPLDVVLARKLPAPQEPELGFGAVAEDGTVVVDRELARRLGLGAERVAEIVERVRAELVERGRRYRGARAAVSVAGRTAIVVDDGLGTGVTMEAAVAAARSRGAVRVVAAAPVSSTEAAERLRRVADDFVCPVVDPFFTGVGAYYGEFPQLTDEEVVALLEAAREWEEGAGSAPPGA